MTNILVDPYLLLLPDACTSNEQLEGFVNGLLGWSQAVDRKDLGVFFSERCLNALFDDGWYPYEGRLAPLLKKYGVNNASGEDVNQVIRSIMERSPSLEEYTRIAEVEYDNPVVTPEFTATRLPLDTSRAMIDALITAAVGCDITGTFLPDHFFATRNLAKEESFETLTIQANINTIMLVLPNGDPGFYSEQDLPQQVILAFEVCYCFEDVLSKVNEMTWWGNAENEGQVLNAILAKIQEHRRTGLPEKRQEYQNFTIGQHFLTSIHYYSFHARPDLARNLIDSCARIVLGIPKNEIKEFRDDDRPQAPARIRDQDGAKALRTHLTKGNEGWRLLFWELPDRSIEFANVGPKKELIIYE
jgi:hypothetical protein